MPIRHVRLNRDDNVCVACVDIPSGSVVDVDGLHVVIRQDIPAGHKFALRDIPAGEYVMKYGEIIGQATHPVRAGEHVHLHNLRSRRDRPDRSRS